MSGRVTVSRRMYLTEDRERAVPDGDPAARFLLVAAGGDVAHADAVRYGLLAREPEPAVEAEPEQEEGPAEKQAPTPPNKSRRPAPNKGA